MCCSRVGRKRVCDGCGGGWAGLQDIFMTYKLNDFKETFLRSSIHQALMNSSKGRNANAESGMGNETDGWRERMRERSGEGENYHRCDEWGWWQKPSGDHSVTETGFCGPNFIIMIQSHQHTPSDNSTAGLSSRKHQLNWSGFSGLSQIERGLCSIQALDACRGFLFVLWQIWHAACHSSADICFVKDTGNYDPVV